MDILFQVFEQAQRDGSGPLLSTTILPLAPPNDPNRLRTLFSSTNSLSVQQMIRAGLLAHTNTEIRFSKAEGNAWVDVYVAFWKAIGELITVEESVRPQWEKVYEAWKEVTNALIKGYSSAGFEAWTVPCLYVAGRYLRIFAIKADEASRSKNALGINTVMHDDIAGDWGRNDKLEDAARVINRIFNLCISDRYAAHYKQYLIERFSTCAELLNRAPLAESRKWGLYYTTNLLFKTYFKVSFSFKKASNLY